jgi:hypothetical protein
MTCLNFHEVLRYSPRPSPLRCCTTPSPEHTGRQAGRQTDRHTEPAFSPPVTTPVTPRCRVLTTVSWTPSGGAFEGKGARAHARSESAAAVRAHRLPAGAEGGELPERQLMQAAAAGRQPRPRPAWTSGTRAHPANARAHPDRARRHHPVPPWPWPAVEVCHQLPVAAREEPGAHTQGRQLRWHHLLSNKGSLAPGPRRWDGGKGCRPREEPLVEENSRRVQGTIVQVCFVPSPAISCLACNSTVDRTGVRQSPITCARRASTSLGKLPPLLGRPPSIEEVAFEPRLKNSYWSTTGPHPLSQHVTSRVTS